MVIKDGGALVETTRMPGIAIMESLEIEMMTELVAERAQEGPERRDFLPHCCFHPNPNQHSSGMVVAKEFGPPAPTGPKRSGRENLDLALGNAIEVRSRCNKFCGVPPNVSH